MENLDDTPSSQVRAFCRETSGATETMSVPTAKEAKLLLDAILRTVELIRFVIKEAMVDVVVNCSKR